MLCCTASSSNRQAGSEGRKIMQGTNTSTTVMPVRAYMQAGCEGEGEALLRPGLDEANPLDDERRWGTWV